MDIFLLGARVVVAGIFLVAALAKLADRGGSRQAVADFGVPARLVGPTAVGVPLVELAVAVALIPAATAWWGALGALASLILFSAAIGVNLARGRKPDCHCFGQLHSAPVGWHTLARNGALAAAAAFVVAFGFDDAGPSAGAWLGDLSTAQLASVIAGALLALVVAVEAAFLFHLIRQNGRLLLRMEALERSLGGGTALAAEREPEAATGLPVGSEAPRFNLSGIHGETLTLEALLSVGRDVLLVFTDPKCGPCNALLSEVGAWQRDHSASFLVVPVSRGTPDENRPKTAEHGLINVLLQADREVDEAYEVDGTPSAVVVRADGTIGSPLAAGPEAIRALVARTVAGETPAPAPAAPPTPVASSDASRNGAAPAEDEPAPPAVTLHVGDPAPPVRLRDLTGRTLNLTGFRGSETVVLFWDPGCGFCSQILEDVRRWEADPPEGAPKLLLVSTGTAEANDAMELRSPVLLDSDFGVGNSFGAPGTPTAIRIDRDGNVASNLAVGGAQVLALLGVEGAEPPTPPPAAAIGDDAPDFERPSLDGTPVRLADYRGKETLLVFWNPGCGFCRRMVDDLNGWLRDRPAAAPEVVLVSTGTPEANREMGIETDAIVLDDGFTVGASFGADGTPMAVLIDGEGRIASHAVSGAPAVLELARGEQQAQARS
jgi:peroxiredoxin